MEEKEILPPKSAVMVKEMNEILTVERHTQKCRSS
jgi:hypothetical protein